MIICHIAPFAPARCGLYEAARDMIKADALAGHTVIFIDAGVSSNGVQETPVIGGKDDRGNFSLVTGHPDQINDADLIIMHTGCPDAWLVGTQTPLIWTVHGRPKACFLPSNGSSYELYRTVPKWKRSKKMLYFWPEFKEDWEFNFNGKDLILEFPVIDHERFSPEGEKYNIIKKGQTNVLICDSDREDVGLYNLMVGLINTSKHIKGLKFHFIGCFDFPISNRYQILIDRLNELGTLGDVIGRVANIETAYRAMDVLISPNKIIVRTIAEALMCKLPVIAQNGCKVAHVCCDMDNPEDVRKGFEIFLDDSNFDDRSHLFTMENYSKVMNPIYEQVVKGM